MATKRKSGRRHGSGGPARRRRLRPLVMIVALVTAAALVAWGVAVSGGPSRFWSSGEPHGHGEITDAEREKLQEVLESIDRDDDRSD